MNPEQLCKLAKFQENDNKEKALECYNQIIENFPKSKYEQFAKLQIDRINGVSIETKNNSFERYLDDNIKDNLGESDIGHIILTTAPQIDGIKIIKHIDIITSECAFGINLFKDFFAGVSDFFGGRSGSTEKVLRDARKLCLNGLRKEAAMIEADAVIAVKLDYSEFSGKGKSMLFLAACGTAVKISK
ncbi:MAG: YbjQ family protein [Desulfobulbaceae bacterium]|nr:YbjQ family protein [Desulfobulbaceae bacterium]